MSTKHFVLDTNILLHDPGAVTSFDEHTVVIPMVVLQELDNIKQQKTRDVCREARVAIRQIEDIVGDASHQEILAGVPIGATIPGIPDTAKLTIFPDHSTDFSMEPFIQDPINDDIIINVALKMQQDGIDVVLVSNDINMRLKAKGCGMERVESYSSDKTVDDVDLLPRGHRELEFNFWDAVGAAPKSYVDEYRIYYHVDASLFPEDTILNEYFYSEDQGVMFRVKGHDEDGLLIVEDITYQKALDKKIWGIHPKDEGQAIAVHSLLDQEQALTTLLGPAGTGKTLVTIATALEMVFEKKRYDKIIFTRSMQSQFEDIGFLPGSEAEKTMPWCGGAFDSLEFLHKNDNDPQSSVEFLLEQGKLQFRALNFIRGRSFQDTILIIDEAQNLSATQIKTILSRAGKNCKVVLLGNLAQIDNQYVSPLSSGLTYAVEKTKMYHGASVIQLEGVIRSELADFVEKNF
ncbi:PhoH family protein [Vibrio phage 2.275.O._10N.286.54.E11]|nr:PhoH family protein [Vibrio phage 2.275.O._10N.286.54.E11]